MIKKPDSWLAAVLVLAGTLGPASAQNQTAFQLSDSDFDALARGLVQCVGNPEPNGGCAEAAEIILRSPHVTAAAERNSDGGVSLKFVEFSGPDAGADYGLVADLLLLGCDKQHAQSCFRIAELLDSHAKFNATEEEIDAFFDRACEYGSAEGCERNSARRKE
jgi:hypothetical protein